MLDLPFVSIAPQVNEDFDEQTDAELVVKELALRKVNKVIQILKESPQSLPPLADNAAFWVCGADTLISLDSKILGKPRDRRDAACMLRLCSRRDHQVITAIALYNGHNKTTDSRSVQSTVSFAPLSDDEIEWYLDSGEWKDAAGSYKIQGLAACFISGISGSYSSIVGLPLREFYVMLRDNGYPFGG